MSNEEQHLRQRQIVMLHVGQCGIQNCTNIWDTLQGEHNLDPNGVVCNSDGWGPNTLTCFRETSSGGLKPRAILVDLDPTCIDTIRNGKWKNTFSPIDVICGSEDAASCYARGRYVQGVDVIYEVRERLRCQLEACDHCMSVIHTAATSGGTGSGIIPDIVNLDEGRRNYTSIGVKVYPSVAIDNALGYYNTVLHMNALHDLIDVNILVDNHALYKIAESSYNMTGTPTFYDLNQQIATVISGLTIGDRFPENIDIMRFQTCLVPYVGLSYIGVTVASYQEPTDRPGNVRQLIKYAFGEYTACSVDRTNGLYLGSFLCFRGNIHSSQAYDACGDILNNFRFASWIPGRVSLGHSSQTIGGMGANNVMHLYNHTAIGDLIATFGKWFDVSYSKGTFVHWYLKNSMNEAEFEESIQALELLRQVYESIGSTGADDVPDNME